MTGYEFSQGEFQNVEWLMKETDLLYERIIATHGVTKLHLTRDRIVEARNWKPSLPLISKNFDAVLDEMKIFYVPKAIQPGPAFVFPQRDVFDHFSRARLKPVGDWLMMNGEAVR